MRHHIPFALLVDMVEARYAADERERAHIAVCRKCSSDAMWIERVLELMRTDHAEAPPPNVLARAKHLFRSYTAVQQPGSRRRVVAALSFDSAHRQLASGIRAGLQAERRMLFSAEAFEIDLRIVPNGALWAISGQLLGAEDGRLVELRGPNGTAQTALNELSEFALPAVSAGSYMLTLRLADLDIEIPDLEIGP